MKPYDIKQLRAKLGLTQEGLAKKLEVSIQTVTRWEQGIFRPSPMALKQLQKLAKEVK